MHPFPHGAVGARISDDHIGGQATRITELGSHLVLPRFMFHVMFFISVLSFPFHMYWILDGHFDSLCYETGFISLYILFYWLFTCGAGSWMSFIYFYELMIDVWERSGNCDCRF